VSDYFGTTAFFPGTFFALVTAIVLISGQVIDCRRSSQRFLIKRADSPVYYWMCVLIFGGISVLMIAEKVPVHW